MRKQRLKKMLTCFSKSFFNVKIVKKNIVKEELDLKYNWTKYIIYRFTLTDSNILFISIFRRIFFGIQMHCVRTNEKKYHSRIPISLLRYFHYV